MSFLLEQLRSISPQAALDRHPVREALPFGLSALKLGLERDCVSNRGFHFR
jgi:hypothetical protein